MAITVKELIKDQLDWADESGKYGDLAMPVILESYKEIFENILKTYENELAEKDKEISNLKRDLIKCVQNEIKTKIETQLYKEDFEKFTCFWNCCEDEMTFYLKDNSKYDKLPSKDMK